jgi:hypothetical protein
VDPGVPSTRATLAVVVLLLALSSPAACDLFNPPDPGSVVPREEFTYDALASLAASGAIPGYVSRDFLGDTLFSRRDVAEITLSLIERPLGAFEMAQTNLDLVSFLVREYRKELLDLGAEEWKLAQYELLPKGFFVTGSARAWATDSEGDTDADAYGRMTAGWTLGENTSLIVTQTKDRDYFRGGSKKYPTTDQAYVSTRWLGFGWTVGRRYIRWGPCYTGGSLLNDTAPPFTVLQFERDVDFGNFLWLGRWHLEQFHTTFKEGADRKYVFGRRISRKLGPKVDIAASETVKMGVQPSPLMLVVPFYVYQLIEDFKDNEEYNVLMSGDMTWRIGNGGELYGEITVDDITNPFGGFERPRKIAMLAGFHSGSVLDPTRTDLRAEFIVTDKLLYTHPNAEVADTYKGIVLGHPYGPDIMAAYFRVARRLSPKLWGSLELDLRRQRSDSADGPGDLSRAAFALAYDHNSSVSITARIAPTRRTSSTGSRESSTDLSLEASFGF